MCSAPAASELSGEREHPAFAVLRRARIEPNFTGCAVHLPPLEREDLARRPPARDGRALDEGPQLDRQVVVTLLNCSRSKNPLRMLCSLIGGLYGRLISVPPCTAQVNLRLRAINSRLSSAWDAPAACRRATTTRASAVPIAVRRRPPKNGLRCFAMRSVRVLSDRFSLVRDSLSRSSGLLESEAGRPAP